MKKLLLVTLVLLASMRANAQDQMLGEVKIFTGNFAPRGWMACEGQLLPIASYSALFSILGTTYGGDGITTFALPDLRGRVPMGVGTGPGLTNVYLGERKGSEKVTITKSQIPAHNHADAAVYETLDATAIGGAVRPTQESVVTSKRATDHSINDDNTGGNQPIDIVQPSLGVRYIICIEGIYPSRS